MSTHYHTQLPTNTLLRRDLERDACGVGFVAHIKGERSHKILKYGIESVCNGTQRIAVDADGKTDDGSGVSTQVPMGILGRELAKLGVVFGDTSRLAVGRMLCWLSVFVIFDFLILTGDSSA